MSFASFSYCRGPNPFSVYLLSPRSLNWFPVEETQYRRADGSPGISTVIHLPNESLCSYVVFDYLLENAPASASPRHYWDIFLASRMPTLAAVGALKRRERSVHFFCHSGCN